MRRHASGHRLSCLLSLIYFGLCALSLARAASSLSNHWSASFVWLTAAAYGLLVVGALIFLVKTPKEPLTSPDLRWSLRTQKTVRLAVFAVPLPIVAVFGCSAAAALIGDASGLCGETFERAGQYGAAHFCYQKMEDFHGIAGIVIPADEAALGGICDKLHRYYDADCHYELAERMLQEQYCAQHCPALSSTGLHFHRTTIIALPRMARLLADVPEEAASREFSFAWQVFEHKGESSLSLGRSHINVDLRLIVRDFRRPPELLPEATQQFAPVDAFTEQTTKQQFESSTIGPQSSDASIIHGVNTAGVVLSGEELRQWLAEVPVEIALAEFNFAKDFCPGRQRRHMKEAYSSESPAGAFLQPKSVRDLVPDEIAIIESADYDRLLLLDRNTMDSTLPLKAIQIRVFEKDGMKLITKERADWLIDRAKRCGYKCTVKSGGENEPTPPMMRGMPDVVGMAIVTKLGSVSLHSTNGKIFGFPYGQTDDSLWNYIRDSFDEQLRAIACHNAQLMSSEKPKYVQFFIARDSTTPPLSQPARESLIARLKKDGYIATLHDDRTDPVLFTPDERSRWNDTEVVTVSLQNDSYFFTVSPVQLPKPMMKLGPGGAGFWKYNENDCVEELRNFVSGQPPRALEEQP
jgi:hypothetical protein